MPGYLNHAGTSWPKPSSVVAAVTAALQEEPRAAALQLESDHAALASWLGVSPESLLLTPGCTSALHFGITDIPWKAGDTVLVGAFEHMGVERPAFALRARGVHVEVAKPGQDGMPVDLGWVEGRLSRGDVRLMAFSMAANVTGAIHPIKNLQELAQRYGAVLLVDAAQTAGWLELRQDVLPVDMLAFGSHKGLQGPWGLGGLYIRPGLELEPPRASGRLDRPSWCDVGSVDRAALAGVLAGIEWLAEPERAERLSEGRRRCEELQNELQRAGARMLGPQSVESRVPTVAFVVDGVPSAEIAKALAEDGLIVSAGQQCAPLAHRNLGTEGVVRMSFGPSSSNEDLEMAISAVRRISGKLINPSR